MYPKPFKWLSEYSTAAVCLLWLQYHNGFELQLQLRHASPSHLSDAQLPDTDSGSLSLMAVNLKKKKNPWG